MSFPKWPDARITSVVIFLYLCIYVCVIFFLTLCFCLIFMIISLHYFSFYIHYNNAKYLVSTNLLEKFFQVFIWSFLKFYQLSPFVLLISYNSPLKLFLALCYSFLPVLTQALTFILFAVKAQFKCLLLGYAPDCILTSQGFVTFTHGENHESHMTNFCHYLSFPFYYNYAK